jgi:phosphoribosylaminoimidazole carboxylase PurE protein
MKKQAAVAIIMGSDSDLEVMFEAGKICEEFGVNYEIKVLSAHRSPNLAHEYISKAKKRGIKTIIAGAGGSAHLAGVATSLTTLPIIGVPIRAKTLDGLDSLLSTVSMPPGVPVATVGINSAKNAGLLAIQILATNDKNLEAKLVSYKTKMENDIKAKNEKLDKVGVKKYLEK